MTDTPKPTSIAADLADIQHKMRAPKNKTNEFGGYKYRNAEMILAAFKGLGIDAASLYCTDTLQEVAGHIFVTATARLTIGGESIEAQGHAMHPLQKKGMDACQITGSASSYARKYALCGLFAIEDETQDPDAKDNREDTGNGANKAASPKAIAPHIEAIEGATTGRELLEALGKIGNANDIPEVAQARVDRIITLVRGAQSAEQIQAFQKAFSPDWKAVEQHAVARRQELQSSASTADQLGDDIPEAMK